MITVERYQQITADFTSTDAEVQRCINDAVQLLEEYLDRPLPRNDYQENMRPDRYGRLWPRATPLQSADGYEIDGLALTGAGAFGPAVSFLDPSSFVEVNYNGGWIDQREDGYDPQADATPLPYCIAADLAWAAHRLAHPASVQSGTTLPAGATSVRLGDAAVTYGASGPGAVQDTTSWWSRRTRGYRWAPIHTGPDRHVLTPVGD